jgi:hypothetical protein
MAGRGVAMGWGSKLSYPPDATRSISVKATPLQKLEWETAARSHGKASAGAFLAFAADLYLALMRAYRDANQAHNDALNPVGYAEEARRRQERERERAGEQ